MGIIKNHGIIDLLKTINKHGFDAYIVGGYIRDQLLGVTSLDYDIATNATPFDIITIFKDEVITKDFIKFMRVDVTFNHLEFQITSFRKDGNYKNHRYPSLIEYTSDINIDAMRRDFTFNAIYCDAQNHLIDPYNGLLDLEKRQVVTIKDPLVSFEEDALRILRALRLMAQFDMKCNQSLQEAMILNFDYLLKLKNTRQYQQEYEKLKNGAYYFSLSKKLNNDLIDLISIL